MTERGTSTVVASPSPSSRAPAVAVSSVGASASSITSRSTPSTGQAARREGVRRSSPVAVRSKRTAVVPSPR
ncbi:MAG: hypothetical protein IPF99_18165 [Deltaproteobacteria bacterium]|nr:hypothetical protein [Deltaproteobacteria bacterium]